ncbi:muropeptide transporter [Piscirickettsia salmonis]|uniref:MFS transporter n=1 Tax=Piscirickettsia salmonis TaxID=1238 RepID=A0A1L6TA27_PISSA|nr:MFS transporter [Piscirickettsia salmonis]AKP73244.1 MFS transporter [Piscirickettsia salmonis LF-89 = ATCC VR-1361]ALB21935.1 MFS transporter [Piscirickettsia salmonis]AOS34094.1 MFS transporter [Piscirickettsia salmonis]APS61500.1 MFS transporter [Piscirickettsia salmonis]APS64743.1 MFS transporter [Piscirickettsia salmonis]
MNLSLNRRTTAVFLLTFSSSLPLILVGSTLSAWYTVAGVSLLGIGALSMVQQPYIFKFLWAPLMDRFSLFGWCRRRSWILLTQILLVIGLVLMAYSGPKQYPFGLAMIALILAFFSASQDIAIDAYRIDILHANELGMGAAITSLAGRIAMLFGGAVALVFAAEIGWQNTYLMMAAVMALEILATLAAPALRNEEATPRSLQESIVGPLKDFVRREHALSILIFILTYKMCDALALALNTPFLIRGVGFSLLEMGTIYKTMSLAASLLGTVVGGIFYKRLGLYRTLMCYGILQALSNLAYMGLALASKSYFLMAAAVFVEYFCGALSTVAFVAYLMSLCKQRFSATQYAILSAIIAIPRVYFGPLAAIMVDYFGWAQFYLITCLIGFPPLILLLRMKKYLLNYRLDTE